MTGVDLARGLALLGMMAKHVFDDVTEHGPTATGLIASGRAATTFALVAGVSIAFLSGGRRILHGRARTAAAAGLAVRAAMIGAIGLLLGFAGADIELILAYYAVFFLLSIPLLGLRPRTLALLSVAFAALGPVLLFATDGMGLPDSGTYEPTFVTLATEPLGLLVQILVTGDYPAVVYMAFVCAGLAIGRLDLTSRRVAGWLLGGGVALAAASQVASRVLLYPLGGLDRLIASSDLHGDRAAIATQLLWDPPDTSSWWYLALPAPHAHTTLDVTNVLGSAMAVLGAALLLTRIRALGRLLGPIRAAGTMTLTLYSAHILLIALGVFEDWEIAQYLLLVVSSIVFAVLWSRVRTQGPLEKLVATISGDVRRAVLPNTPAPARTAKA
ncbi:heparan-alpha-glucosaminide N-acetyltransferase domain-containing protein [Geodermatophilus sp. URMC 61]|uniref:heparan-alpha-glucosaminide N-acetyltransferase domain-containing protein n=1 Tax=Geodermatophilus sp. URMC 61 TaxID=3423411 RepID=UPI00406CB29C